MVAAHALIRPGQLFSNPRNPTMKSQEELYKLAIEAIAKKPSRGGYTGPDGSFGSWARCLAQAAVGGDESEVMDYLKETEQPEEQPSGK
jgi:hypothetical protein